MKRACLTCGAPFTPANPSVRRCPLHQGTHTGWSHNRDRRAQARFRAAVLGRDGHRCTFVVNGHRCEKTEDLRAAHIVPLADGGTYDPSNGRTLCREHDRATDPHAR